MSTREAEKQNAAAGKQAMEKPAKEKKTKVSKEKKPRTAKASSHPPYFQMIKEALLALKEKGGSSPHAIAKYMEEKHKAVLPGNFKKMLALQLKNSASKGKLTKVKASYKLSESGKKENAPAATAGKKKPTVAAKEPTKLTKSKKPAAMASAAGTDKRAKAPKKAATKPVAKKPASAKKVKKMTPAKAKQPKSIKSPAKKARKAVA